MYGGLQHHIHKQKLSLEIEVDWGKEYKQVVGKNVWEVQNSGGEALGGGWGDKSYITEGMDILNKM